MLKEEEIFKKNLSKENLLERFPPSHIIWRVATNTAREFAAIRPIRTHMTIEDYLREDESSCNHHWLHCGNNFFICNDESCGAFKAL